MVAGASPAGLMGVTPCGVLLCQSAFFASVVNPPPGPALHSCASQLRVHHLAIPQHRSRPKRGKAWNVRPACRAEGSPDGPRLTARGWRCAVAFFSWSNRRPHCDRCRSSQGAAVPTLAFALVWSWHASIGPESKRLARIAPSLTQHRCCIAPVGANPAFASCRLRPRIAGPWVFRVWCCDERIIAALV